MSAPNPYAITGPALISFSGGRTSAFMLRQILDAHGGTLPDDVVVAFANTGKEREETLRFVHECGSRWGVHIHWLEWRARSGPKAGRYEVVGFNSASRQGEPFAGLIASKKYTPNSMMRFCTIELKIRVMRDFCQDALGWKNWVNVIGLRHDEGHRVLKSLARNDSGKEPWRNAMPMAAAKHTVRDVKAFWDAQDFDLGLKHYEGNCDLCFLKGRGKLKAIIREQPGAADWWSAQEVAGKGRFTTEYSYADLAREVAQQPHLFDEIDDEPAEDCTAEVCEGDNDPISRRVLQREFERTFDAGKVGGA
jgi:3'-phosphoadenosine 5'-phosphosulfate sulfotransferase (PAPS reductase)/FAD synthetase